MALIENTSLYKDFLKITNSNNVTIGFRWSCQFIIDDLKIDAYKIIRIDFNREYDLLYGDDIQLTVMLPKGKVIHQLAPNRDNLKVTLTRQAINTLSDEILFDEPVVTYDLRAIFIEQFNTQLETNSVVNVDEEFADISGLVEVEFQLLEPSVEMIRLMTWGGIVRKTSALEAVVGILTNEVKSLPLENKYKITGVDFVSPNNVTVREHVIIPHGTKLIDLVKYAHTNCGGIYSSGIRQFIQNDKWYIFPPFDTKRFNSTSRTLTIINCPSKTYTSIEQTYIVNGMKLVIISTGETKFFDDSEVTQLNEGNGVRFANSDRVIEEWRDVKDNVATVDRSENTSQFLGTTRRTKLNSAFIIEGRLTDNGYVETSKVARRQGSHLVVTWENSNPELIYPGMPVKYNYIDSDEVKEVYGTVIRAHSYVDIQSRAASVEKHMTNTQLTLFIDKQ